MQRPRPQFIVQVEGHRENGIVYQGIENVLRDSATIFWYVHETLEVCQEFRLVRILLEIGMNM